ANERTHLARARVERHERGLQRLAAVASGCTPTEPPLDLGERARDLRLRRLLHVEVEGRLDLQALAVDLVPSKPLDELLPDVLLEVLPVRLLPPQRGVQHESP